MLNETELETSTKPWTLQSRDIGGIAGLIGFFLFLCATVLVGPASAQFALPVSDPNAFFWNTTTELVYTIDLDTLPARPTLIVDVNPDGSNPDLRFEVDITNFVLPIPNEFSTSSPECAIKTGGAGWTSEPAVGPLHLEARLFICDPRIDVWDGGEADVVVRVLDFGPAGPPETVQVDIHAITSVPFGLLPVQVSGPQSLTVTATDSTVLYADDPLLSNGLGAFLWSGTRASVNPLTGLVVRHPRTSLLKFITLENQLPATAVVSNVELNLVALGGIGSGGLVSLRAVAPGPSWFEGNANAAGDEFFGATPPNQLGEANYIERTSLVDWIVPGGDTTQVLPLDTQFISVPGPHTFTSAALTSAVQTMLDTDGFENGFKLSGPSTLFVSTSAVRFGSDDHPVVLNRPTLTVDFSLPEPVAEGLIDPDLVDFINEGENLRWIYDLDLDGIFTTPINGVCEESSTDGLTTVPYSYSYSGPPGYVGYDCCTWRIFSDQAGVVGTGQALFFHNLDVSNPANMPPDFDGDGMRDPCDNCPFIPNGPLLGSCMSGLVATGGTCQSDLECGTGETCDLSQLDDDGNTIGNACPEPGFSVGLLLGAWMLGASRPSSQKKSVRSPAQTESLSLRFP